MKIITISKVGYNHPSQANWNYGVWKLDLIDTESKYNASYTLKETFGGDYRLRDKYPAIIETKQVYTTTGEQQLTGIERLPDIESKEVENIINAFYA